MTHVLNDLESYTYKCGCSVTRIIQECEDYTIMCKKLHNQTIACMFQLTPDKGWSYFGLKPVVIFKMMWITCKKVFIILINVGTFPQYASYLWIRMSDSWCGKKHLPSSAGSAGVVQSRCREGKVGRNQKTILAQNKLHDIVWYVRLSLVHHHLDWADI